MKTNPRTDHTVHAPGRVTFRNVRATTALNLADYGVVSLTATRSLAQSHPHAIVLRLRHPDTARDLLRVLADLSLTFGLVITAYRALRLPRKGTATHAEVRITYRRNPPAGSLFMVSLGALRAS